MGQARVGHDKARYQADCDALIVAIHQSTWRTDQLCLIDMGPAAAGPMSGSPAMGSR